jgi:hypothetical protein
MTEWLLIFIGASLSVIGVLGSFLPVIPGPPLSFIAVLLLHFSGPYNKLSAMVLLLLLVITIIITALDYVIPVWGTKKFGGTKYGVWGSTLGLIVGLFLGPLGIVFGPFFGALIGELIASKNSTVALRSAWGSLVGFILSTGLKLLFTLFVATIFFSKAIGRIGDLI